MGERRDLLGCRNRRWKIRLEEGEKGRGDMECENARRVELSKSPAGGAIKGGNAESDLKLS